MFSMAFKRACKVGCHISFGLFTILFFSFRQKVTVGFVGSFKRHRNKGETSEKL